ncbi:hypothetical protein J6590_014805 [Homalodisca vitripennis]|nr:hypothetical protein J6590_014805 [Homalodisca vitripennis]
MFVSDIIDLLGNHQPAGSIKFDCPSCGRSFNHKNNLYRHQKLDCGKLPQLSCNICPYKCKRKDQLKLHVAAKHGFTFGERQVPVCPVRPSVQGQAKSHTPPSLRVRQGPAVRLPSLLLQVQDQEQSQVTPSLQAQDQHVF